MKNQSSRVEWPAFGYYLELGYKASKVRVFMMYEKHNPADVAGKKLAIIGASDFQNPLILKAKERGIETHVFAWKAGAVGEVTADYFYPISITEKDAILRECQRIGIDGIASIGSDLANIAVSYVADRMGLVANSPDCVHKSTDKHAMRDVFASCGDPSPVSILVTPDLDFEALTYPVIVKPVDRSGSRGVSKVASPADMASAIALAREEGFSDDVLVEQFVGGQEFSVEYVSWKGHHRFLALTEKFTTGAPHFIEYGHLEPARVGASDLDTIKSAVEHALNSLGVEFGASHSEIKLQEDGSVVFIEIGSRMGGDCIGSHLVELSSGYDYVNAVIDVALGLTPVGFESDGGFVGEDAPEVMRWAAVRFIFSQEDYQVLQSLRATHPECINYVSDIDISNHPITDSATSYGYFVFSSKQINDIEPFLPQHSDLER